MESIGKECKELKKEYDACFNVWFAEKYLKGQHHANFCDEIFKVYQGCVREAIEKQKIELWQVDKDVLGTEEEKKPQTTSNNSKKANPGSGGGDSNKKSS